MKILVIFTGGTIGSTVNDDYISPSKETSRKLLKLYEETYGKEVHFEILEPYSILSENLSSKELNLLLDCVFKALKGEYDGIIVTHGTDTVQYSAAALSYALGTNCLPVVLVSSNYPLDDPRANGLKNFAAAVELIKEKSARGVFVAYHNEKEGLFYHRGGSLISHRESDDALFGFNGKYYASLSDGKITFYQENEEREGFGEFTFCQNPEILVIEALPGYGYKIDQINCKAIILRPYHSGTLNTDNEKFQNFCRQASKEEIPVFVVNAREGTTYLSSKEFERLGIIPVYSSAFISTYIRLWIAISRGEDLRTVF